MVRSQSIYNYWYYQHLKAIQLVREICFNLMRKELLKWAQVFGFSKRDCVISHKYYVLRT